MSWNPQLGTSTPQRDCQIQVEGKDPFPGPAGCSCASAALGVVGHLCCKDTPLTLCSLYNSTQGLFGRGAFLQASGTSPSLDLSVMADSSFMMTQDNSLRGLQCVLSGPIDQLILKDPNSMLAYCGCSLPPPSFASRPETEQTDSKACSVMEQCIHLSGFPSHFHC